MAGLPGRNAGPRPHLRIPFATRFWSHVSIPTLPGVFDIHGNPAIDPSACWDWQGKGTGTQKLTGSIRLPLPSTKFITAPRAALLLWEGATDADIELRNEERRSLDAGHTVCDRPSCCNPMHLAWQEHKENIHEYIRKFKSLAGKPMNPDNLPTV